MNEIIEVETDFAFLSEDGLILHMIPRFKPRTLDKGVFKWGEYLLNLDELLETKRKSILSGDTLRIRCRLWRVDGKAVIPAKFFVRTVLSVKKKSFLWDIERFSSFECDRKETFVLRSESLNQEAALNIGVNGQGKIVISISSLHKNIKVFKFKAFMTDTNGCKTDCGIRNVFPETIAHSMCKLALPFSKKYLMDNKNVYLKNDVISLSVECSWCDGFDLNVIEGTSFGINAVNHGMCVSNSGVGEMCKVDDLKEDFETLYAEGILSDVKPKTKCYPAKNILSARSPVFRSIFARPKKKTKNY
ncbi:TD and POZ domain-containing protein 1 [Trichonephila inaurata madagascariensis]|uniref:TD and POZ domain-containing protein 1 n=1 Tax=Trichonephila inaurata madagascariensis TaxID=2747483 RepID=A0A8X6WLG6_9ARAC|nr:TD and POZ domain-containing protein 1 [Trichonephila inaurata madagascariensis]